MSTTMETAVSSKTINFARPLPGLPGCEVFTLTEISDGLFTLVADDADAVRLFVVDPAQFVVGYEPVIDNVARDTVGLASGDAGLVLTVVHPPVGDASATANLLAPIVINQQTGAAVQVILDGDWPLRAPLG